MRETKAFEKQGNHFSTYFVERAGTLLIEKNSANNLRSRKFTEMTTVDKSSLEIEQAFRLAFEKVNRAGDLAKNFLEISLAVKANELEDYYDKKAGNEINSAEPKFWFGVAQGFVASYFFVLFIGGMVFVLQAANLGIKNAIEAAFNVQITS